ncbi:MAG: YceI family protein [Acidimicrobiales bacterium]|nr:YceI family protein [Acidimicrobiales bacterium]
MLKKLAIAAVAVLVVVGGAFWWFVLRDDAPEELSLEGRSTDTTEAATPAPDTYDGTWTVQTGGETTAGLRIDESFASGLADHTAVGRSDDVSGSFTVDGSTVSEGSFTVDLTTLTFTDDPGRSVAGRANAMKTRGLETEQFAEATFEITSPVDLGAAPADGETVTATVTGDLTLHGVTNEVTFDVEAEVAGGTITVVTADPVPVVLADYDIDKPTGGPIAEISDEGSFEFLIVLAQG